MSEVISVALIFARIRDDQFYFVFTQTTRDANFEKKIIQEHEPGNGTFLINCNEIKIQKILKF